MSQMDDNSYLLWPYVNTCRLNSKREDVKTLCWVVTMMY